MTIHEIIDAAAKLNEILPTLNAKRTAILHIDIHIPRHCSLYSGNFRSFDELKTVIKEKDFSEEVKSTILDNIEKLDFNFEEEYFDEDYHYVSGVVLRTKSNQEVRVSINLDL